MTPTEIEYQAVSEAYDKAWEARDIETVGSLLFKLWDLEDQVKAEREAQPMVWNKVRYRYEPRKGPPDADPG